MVKDPSLIGQDGHVNLFVAEEYDHQEKEKQGRDGNRENIYLKRTSNLGELFETNSKPWYTNKNKQRSKYEEVCKKEEEDHVSKHEAKTMLRIGKSIC